MVIYSNKTSTHAKNWGKFQTSDDSVQFLMLAAALSSYNGLDIIDGEFRGSIDQFKITDNQALYTSNFTPGDLGFYNNI